MRMREPDVVGYINAGGRGTRLEPLFTPDDSTGIAKALLLLGDPQIHLVDHHVANLRQQGVERMVIAAGDQARVHEYSNDMYGGDSDVTVTKSDSQLGTGGDLLAYAARYNLGDAVVIQNVDTILDIDLDEFVEQHRLKREVGCVATIGLTLLDDVPNQNAYRVASNGYVLGSKEFSADETIADSFPTYRASSTGAVVIDLDFLRRYPRRVGSEQVSIYRHLLHDVWRAEGLFAYDNGERFFRDVGTVATWQASHDDKELQRYLRYNETVRTS